MSSSLINYVGSIAALRSIPVAACPQTAFVSVESYLAGNIYGGGPFWWNAADTRADDAGWVINPTGNAGNGRWNRIAARYNLEDFGAFPTTDYTQSAIGAANVTAFNNAIAAMPTGETLYWSSGSLLIVGSGLVINTRKGFVCSTSADYILANLVNTTDAFTYQGLTDDVDIVVNVCGLSNNCRDAVVVNQLISARRLWVRVQCNPARYGLNIGGIEDCHDVRYMSTTNFSDYPNQSSPSNTHVYIANDGANGTTLSDVWVDISGGTTGVVGVAGVSDAGNIRLSGVIQGLTGNPFNFSNMQGIIIEHLDIESNSGSSSLTGCYNFNVKNIYMPNQSLYLYSCTNYGIENVQGTLVIDAACGGGWDRNTALNGSDGYFCSSPSHETLSGIIKAGSLALMYGGAGASSARNLATNGLITSWPSGTSAAPAEWSGGSTTWAQVISTTNGFKGNPSGYYAQSFTTTTVLASAASYTPSISYEVYDSEYVSVMIALNPAGTDGQVWIDDGVSPQLIGTATNGVGWQVIRGSMKLAASAAWKLRVLATVGSQTIYIGGVAWCRGTVSPKYLQ